MLVSIEFDSIIVKIKLFFCDGIICHQKIDIKGYFVVSVHIECGSEIKSNDQPVFCDGIIYHQKYNTILYYTILYYTILKGILNCYYATMAVILFFVME